MLQQNFDYYAHITSKLTQSINAEIAFYKNNEYLECDSIKEYHDYLVSRLNGKQVQTLTMSKYTPQHMVCENMILDEYCKDLDIMTFKRPWAKLKEFHKIMKIKEYVNRLPYKKKIKNKLIEKNQKFLIREISDGLRNKKFGKNKSDIIYNPEKMQIESISCVCYNKKKGKYEIDWDD